MAAIYVSAALVVTSNTASASSHADQAAPESATSRVITVPVQHTHIKIAFDPAQTVSEATISFAQPDDASGDMLFLQSDVFPVVSHVSGCKVRDNVSANQLLPKSDPITVTLDC